ncbi:MAG: hypothetical protein J6B63_03085 [Treponema sp.]|nr:hypothetical protein [Treponema sp.]
MTNEEQKIFLQLLNQKKNCLEKILEMTKERKFSVVEEDVERFYNFFQKREKLFEKCSNIQNKISFYNIDDEDKNSFFYTEVQKTKEETREVIAQIIDIDQKNRLIMNKLLQLVKNNLKNLKVSKQVRQGYGEFFPAETYGTFDSKN